MNLRPLVIDDAARAEAARVLAHAEKNHYHPKPGNDVPGDDPAFTARFGTYRAVFTFTHADGLIYRHLSVSVPGKKFPNPVAVFNIAEMFGFAGYDPNKHYAAKLPDGWLMDVNDNEHCVIVAQPIGADVLKEKLQ